MNVKEMLARGLETARFPRQFTRWGLFSLKLALRHGFPLTIPVAISMLFC